MVLLLELLVIKHNPYTAFLEQMSHNLRNLIFQTYKITNLKGIIGVRIIL